MMEGGPPISSSWNQYGLTATGKQKRKRVRSVMGCLTCRKRRVKCDEKRPKCTNCARHPLRVCEYEYENESPEEEEKIKEKETKFVIDRKSNVYSSSDTSYQKSSSMASSSRLTLDEFIPTHSSNYKPPPDYEMMLKERRVIDGMRVELESLRSMDSLLDSETPSLADDFISRLPISKLTRFTSVLSFHSALIRRSFSTISEDPHSRLLCSAIAVLPSSQNSYNTTASGLYTPPPTTAQITHNHNSNNSYLQRPEIYRDFVKSVKENKDNVITGRLGAVAFTLLLCEIIDPSPSSTWRDQLKVMLSKSVERGGPGWMIGVTTPNPGYRGGQIDNRQPLSHSLYAEISAMIEVYACLTSGNIPTLLTYDKNQKKPWILASRSAQMQVSNSIPDSIEVIFGIPRIMSIIFAQVTALVAKRNMLEYQDDNNGEFIMKDMIPGSEGGSRGDYYLKENLDFEIASTRMELEHVWPARLENRKDERRLQYGGRLWRLAILIFLLQEAQCHSTTSLELITHVNAFFDLCQEAAIELGHLAGWLWPILLASCASYNHAQREGFLRLLPYAKSPIGDKDNAEHAHKLLTMVWFYQDTGNSKFHLREALRIDNSLDCLIL
ncbi:uncharacterized protein L201_007569 [Kwoniella dendrophila CBS 6074]|uniref:Zn(2)-C6 fungal-type domain-containing protein n=1 Tax=Kwoniella dendrophila CBS 6074 TaxID=1295534 RepID=A0AAX4K707_9TREE